MVPRRLPARRPQRLIHRPEGRLMARLRCLDFAVRPRLAFIANLDPPILPLAYRHPGLPRRIIAVSLQLKIAVLIAHHPVVGDAPLALQAKHLVQLTRGRRPAVIVLRLGRLARKPGVVIAQILLLQVRGIGRISSYSPAASECARVSFFSSCPIGRMAQPQTFRSTLR